VIVEPALRTRTRHLHRVRDAILAARAATLFAPCLHDAPCPALAAEGDWCHEDRAIDLPPWLVPVARAAGLRWQGLTFAYLVLRKDAFTLAGAIARVHPPGSLLPSAARARVVSGALVSKGKRELFLCGDLPAPDASAIAEPADVAGATTRVRAMRLDRDASASNEAWESLDRGALVTISPAPDPRRPRIGKEARVHEVTLAELASTAAPVERDGDR
jgi:hypothetical protein